MQTAFRRTAVNGEFSKYDSSVGGKAGHQFAAELCVFRTGGHRCSLIAFPAQRFKPQEFFDRPRIAWLRLVQSVLH